jgi:hypothetical protein
MRKRIALFLGTSAFALAEWLMFELLRTPYRPPADMLTFLGTEKYGLVTLMLALAIFWTIVSIWILATTRLTLRHYFGFLTLVAFLMGGVLYIVKHPHRPVTPWELLWS